jgi:hypothetical protein
MQGKCEKLITTFTGQRTVKLSIFSLKYVAKDTITFRRIKLRTQKYAAADIFRETPGRFCKPLRGWQPLFCMI